MAGEPILIVDDTPVNLKLTRILLVNEGYKVMTAGSAEEALELLRGYHPRLVLADIRLPGMDGLELARRIKASESTADITVVAWTAFHNEGDEQRALDAGCDDYIAKPIDTRSLSVRIRECLDRRHGPQAAAAEGPVDDSVGASLPAAEMQALRRRFLSEGKERVRQLLLDLDGQFNGKDAARVVHQWVGTGGLLGYTAISRLARETEAILLEPPFDNAQLRESLTNLLVAFTSPREARDPQLSESIVQSLAGRRVTAIGFPPNEEERLCVALERVNALATFYEATTPPSPEDMEECDLAVVHVHPDIMGSPWLTADSPILTGRPVVLVGERDHLLSLDPAVQALAREFLMDAWQPEEALVRLSLALSRLPVPHPAPVPVLQGAARGPAGAPSRTQVVIADDDPTVIALVRTALQNFGLECFTASDGPEAAAAIRKYRPQAAVLDVNMPGMDGYEVLAAVRSEEIPVRVLLLTARQQESDVIRAFTLGADDYVVKPFSPMELVARLKRLLGR